MTKQPSNTDLVFNFLLECLFIRRFENELGVNVLKFRHIPWFFSNFFVDNNLTIKYAK